MKAILMSIRPQHLVNILNGHKTLELRKTIPKDFKGWVYCYCTKSKPYYEPRINGITKQKMWNIHNDFIYHTDLNGKVVCRFWFDEYNEFKVTEYGIETDGISRLSFINMQEATQLTFEELQKYISVGKIGYAWHIDNLEIFDEPKELSEFYRIIDYDLHEGLYKEPIYKTLLKAPQSWMYVEVKE